MAVVGPLTLNPLKHEWAEKSTLFHVIPRPREEYGAVMGIVLSPLPRGERARVRVIPGWRWGPLSRRGDRLVALLGVGPLTLSRVGGRVERGAAHPRLPRHAHAPRGIWGGQAWAPAPLPLPSP